MGLGLDHEDVDVLLPLSAPGIELLQGGVVATLEVAVAKDLEDVEVVRIERQGLLPQGEGVVLASEALGPELPEPLHQRDAGSGVFGLLDLPL